MRILALVLLVTACSACSDDGGGGGVDATPVIDIDNASCGDLLNFTGEVVDADSTAGTFCGVNGAMLAGGNAMASTAPNGRFVMCIPAMGATNLTLTPPGTASGCSSTPGTYTLPAIAVANPATIRAGAFWSGRMITMQRMATLVPAFDAAKAHVMVHVEGQKRAVAILATHAPALAFNGTAWAAGESGSDVVFPNVDVANGSTMLTVVGGAIGTGPIPLQAGKLTLVTVLAK
jgi:hypothetical protein